MINAIILAAGYSSRAGGFKMELQLQDKAVIQHVVEAFYPICDHIYVVGGFQYQRLIPLLMPYEDKVQLVINDLYDMGMFSSVLTGVRHLEDGCFFITPGDYPLINTKVCQELLVADGDYLMPRCQGKNGHPLLLPFSAKEELLAMNPQENLRYFLQDKVITYVETEESGILKDLDTREDYEALQKLMKGKQKP